MNKIPGLLKTIFTLSRNTDETVVLEKAGQDITPNMRALRLTMKITETLLRHGVSTHDVVSTGLDITETYCKKRVYFDVSSTSVMASQDRGLDREPLTLFRIVKPADPNNLVVQDVQELARNIVKGLPLDEAEKRFDDIIDADKKYPLILAILGNAGVSGGVTLLFTNSLAVFLITLLLGCFVAIFVNHLSKRRVPSFFIQTAAAAIITLGASLVVALGGVGIELFAGINPTLVIVGGIVMLLAGMTIVSTAQDAIDEYYVTASAKFVKTLMLTAGIVMGVVVGVIVAGMLGVHLTVSVDSIPLSDPHVQIIGAVLIAVSWAVYMQSSLWAILWAGIIGGVGWLVYVSMLGVGSVAATGVAAVFIGLAGAIVARLTKSPSIAIIDSAIVALVPGLSLYRGLMQFTNQIDQSQLVSGLSLILMAISIALAIAAGASFGNYIGRPVRSHIMRVHKYMPQFVASNFKRKKT